MIIDKNNDSIGNTAMASVLLLYYHLLRERNIAKNKTIYIDLEDFDGFSFLDINVDDDKLNIDVELIREGAVIYLLCDLNDMILEYKDNYLSQPLAKRIINEIENKTSKNVPEADEIVQLLSSGDKQMDYSKYTILLSNIYNKYVLGRFKSFVL
jgi:hypothetical protein